MGTIGMGTVRQLAVGRFTRTAPPVCVADHTRDSVWLILSSDIEFRCRAPQSAFLDADHINPRPLLLSKRSNRPASAGQIVVKNTDHTTFSCNPRSQNRPQL